VSQTVLCRMGVGDGRWSGKDLEGSGRALSEVLSSLLRGGIEEAHEKPHLAWPVSRSKFEPSTSRSQVERAACWAG
jgi:hypothetical protein